MLKNFIRVRAQAGIFHQIPRHLRLYQIDKYFYFVLLPTNCVFFHAVHYRELAILAAIQQSHQMQRGLFWQIEYQR